MIRMDSSLVNVTKIHSGEGSWNEIKVKVGKTNLEGCHGRFRGRQINSSEFQINFTDGIQFWCGWQKSRLYRKHKEKEKKSYFSFLVRCEMPDLCNCMFIYMLVCVCAHECGCFMCI